MHDDSSSQDARATINPCGNPGGLADRRRARGRVCVIENHEFVRRAVRRLLLDSGYEVVAAVDGDQALAIWGECAAPDVIVSDYHLTSDSTGIAAIERLRGHFGRHIPAVIMTADPSDGPAQDAKAAACALIHKPTDPDELLDAIGHVLG